AASVLRETHPEFTLPLDHANWYVYASYEGLEAVVPRIARDLQKLSSEATAITNELLDPASDTHLRGVFREAFDWLRWASPAVALFRIVLPQSKASDLAALLRAAQEPSLRNAVLLRAAGVIYLASFGENEDEATVRSLETASTRIFSLAAASHGHATLLHAP